MADKDKLYFFSRSRNIPPGKGANEYLNNPNKYKELAAIANWRHMLSNFWVAPFEYNGLKWNSVEHCFQGSKINIASSKMGYQFALDSGSELSRGDGAEAQKKRKMVVLSPEQLTSWENLKKEVLHGVLEAKFRQHPELAQILFATNDAELWHGTPRTQKSRQWELERVRDEFYEY